MFQGTVTSVNTAPGGGYPLALTPAGSTVLVFEDAADFDEEGGELSIDGVVLPYVSADLETDEVTLAAPLAFAVDEHMFVATHPLVEETWATVVLGDDVVEARVPHALKALLPDGEREEEVGEAVYILNDVYGTPEIHDLVGKQPEFDAFYIKNGGQMLWDGEQPLEEKFLENDAALEGARTRLTDAEGRINDAFSEIDLKPDQAYVDAAEQQAKDWADLVAAQQAQAAKQDALDALSAAESDLEAAIASGDAAAIAEAQTKANAARDAAIAAAATDATTKADAARDAAIAAASLDASNKAAEAMTKANAALTAAQQAQATADNAIRTYYSANPPWANGSSQPEEVLGDMWFDTDDGQAYRWSGTSWVVIKDQAIGDALAAAQNAQDTADGKIAAFYQPSAPVEADDGDLWFDTDDGNRVYRRSGTQWVDVADARIGAQAAAISSLQTDLAGVEGTADGKANIYYQSAAPTGLTAADKGDIWIDTSSGRVVKVWSGTAWTEADSRTAQVVADVAKKITTYFGAQPTAPAGGFTTGDLWTDANGKISRWSGSAWVEVVDPKALADGVEQRALSRGTDLVTNGTGYLKSNYNFSRGFTFDPADAPVGANGSFVSTPGASATRLNDEMIPVDPSKTYLLSCAARQQGALAGRLYTGLTPYDAAGLGIVPYNYAYQPGTTTTLTSELKPGDTVVNVASTTGWYTGSTTHQRTIIVWNYVDTFGKKWPKHTYSRICNPIAYAQGALPATQIPLSAPWPASLGTHPAGTEISNGMSGNNYIYLGWGNHVVPQGWSTMSAVIGGIHDGSLGAAATGVPGGAKFPPGTAGVKFLALINRNTSGGSQTDSKIALASISLSDAAAAKVTADAAAATLVGVQTSLTGLQGQVDGKANIYVQTTAPTGMVAADKGDIWIDTSSGRVTKVWSGTAWQEADTRTAQAVADITKKTTTYFGGSPTAPTGGFTTGDLWIDNNGKISRWSGTAWQVTVDPKALADAAQAAAISAAATDATSKANAAEVAAKAAAAADAKAKADAAQAAATSAAATDAQNKADAAKAAAEAAAKTYADTVSSGAEQAAIDAAKADATAKANAAEQAAKDAAAADATAKANAAQAAATSAAAADATNKANAAEQAAKDAAAAALAPVQTRLTTAEGLIDKKAVIWYQSTAPTGLTSADAGDIWINSGVTPKTYKSWSGTGWVDVTDQPSLDTLAKVNTKISTYVTANTTAPTAPTGGFTAGDLWVDSNGKVARWSGSAWVTVTDPKTLATNAEANAKAYALSQTNGVAKTMWSTALPGTTAAPQNSVWYRLDADGKIISVHTQTAAGSAGTTWAPRPIRSEAIDNLDVGKLTAAQGVLNDVVAQHIAARSGQYITLDVSQLTVTEETYLNDVLAEHIASRTGQFLTLDVSDLTVFGNLASAYPSGRNFTFGEGGLQFVDTDGSILFNAPLDPSQPFTFSGEALLQALTTLGNFSMQGTENELSQSARWTISNGMSKPGSSAKINVGWEARSTDVGQEWNAARRGLVFWKTYAFVSTRWYFPGSGDQIHRMDAAGTDGSKTNLTFVYGSVTQNYTQVRIASGGFTVIGDHLYLFGPKHWGSGSSTPWFVQKMSLSADGLTATFVVEWEHAAHTTACIGRDGSAAGSNLLIGVNNFTPAGNVGRLSWQKRKSTDFTVVGSEWLNSDRTSGSEKNILYIEELTADMGGAYVMAYTEGSSFVYAQGPTTGAASESRSFRVKAGGGTTGVAWDGTRFWHHVPADAVLNKHSTTTWFGTYSGEKWWASYTWYDGTAPASETQMATPVPFTMIERASITFTIPPIPGIATAARRYLGRGATAPTRTGMSLDGDPMTGRVARSYPTRPGTTGVNPPPAASTFTGVSPARIESGAGGLVINGDGTGTWPVVENRVNQGVMDYLAALRPKSGSGGSSTTTSSTSATTITGAGEVSFVAPPSGQVRIDVGMILKTSVAGIRADGGYQIRTTGNVDVYTTTSMISNANVEWIKTANWEIYSGLTPGTTYKLRPMFASTGSTGSASASQTSYTATPIA